MYILEDIVNFLEKQTGSPKEEIKPDVDIGNNLGVCIDDFAEMIVAYSKKLDVDMSNYLWYFHFDEEGSWNSIGGLFFKSPFKRVPRITVTPQMLLQFANEGKWNIEYPFHELPKRRYDLIINLFLVLSFLFYLIYRLINWLL